MMFLQFFILVAAVILVVSQVRKIVSVLLIFQLNVVSIRGALSNYAINYFAIKNIYTVHI